MVLSYTGMYDTVKAFDVKVVTSNDSTSVLWYTLKDSKKIYTGENTTDGTYSLKVWTPQITGVGNVQKPSVSLCDEEVVGFEIKGSMYDDLEDSIIQ